MKLTQNHVENLVTEAIKGDLASSTAVKKALVASVLLMAGEIGRPQPLTRLYMGVSKGTADAILNYIRNLNFKHGEEISLDTGKKVKVSFLAFSAADKEFKHSAFADDERKAAAKAMRAKIAAMPEKELLAIEMGRTQNRVEQAAKEFDAQKALADFIKKAALAGTSPAWLEQVNKLLEPTNKVDVKGEHDKAVEAAKNAIARAERQKAQAEKAQERLAKLNGENAKNEAKPDGKAENEPAKAA